MLVNSEPPDFSTMSEQVIEAYMRQRIVGSDYLKLEVFAPRSRDETVRTEYYIKDRACIHRFARNLKVIEKRGSICAGGPSWGVVLHCQDEWAFSIAGDEAYLPQSSGRFIVRIDLEFVEQLIAPADSLVEAWRLNRDRKD